MHSKIVVLTVVIAFWMSSTLSAGVVPGRWEKVAVENLGTSLIVTMQSGERIDGYFKGMTEDNLNLTLPDGKERSVRKAEVAKIITAEWRMGSLTNGFLIGMATGAAIPAIAAISWNEGGAWVPVNMIVWGLVGGAVGVGIDAAVQGHITRYKAPKATTQP